MRPALLVYAPAISGNAGRVPIRMRNERKWYADRLNERPDTGIAWIYVKVRYLMTRKHMLTMARFRLRYGLLYNGDIKLFALTVQGVQKTALSY